MALLVGNSRGPYTQLPLALNAAIVLLWKMKGFVCLCGCVGGSVYDYLTQALNTTDQRQDLLYSVLLFPLSCLTGFLSHSFPFFTPPF